MSQRAKNFLLDINKFLNQNEKRITSSTKKSNFDQSNKRILNEINKLTFQLDRLIDYESPVGLKTANLNLEQIIITALNETFEKFGDRYTKDFSVDMNFKESNLIHGNSDAAHLIFEFLFELVMEHVESNGLLNISVKNIMSVSNDFVKDTKIVISFSSNNSSSVGSPIKKSPHFLMIRELCKKTNFEISYASDDDFRHFEFNVAAINARKTSPPKSSYSSYGAFLRDREDKNRHTSWQFDETDLPTTLEIAIISEEHYRFSQIKAAIRSKLPDKIQVNYTELLEFLHADLTTLESCTIIICDCKPDLNYLTKLKLEKKTIMISNDEISGIKTIPENFDQATWYDHVNNIISREALK